MKSWLITMVSLVVGAGAGYGVTCFEFSGVEEEFATFASLTSSSADAPLAPKARVEGGLEYDFGSMEVKAKQSREFVIRNEGGSPLTIETQGKPTCKCTQFEVRNETIPPGESGVVFLEWQPDNFDSAFSQSATVKTNDPARELIRFTIRGRVIESVRSEPREFRFESVSANEQRTSEARVYFYLDDRERKITSCEFLNGESAPLFRMDWSPLPKDKAFLESNALSGLLVRLTVEPGMPLGSISQTVRLHLDGRNNESVDIPVKGTVVSDISILGGSTFDRERSALILGLVNGQKGFKTELRLLTKGPHRQATRFQIAEIDPDSALRVTIGEPTEILEGKAVMHLLTIEIPPGTAPVNRIASTQFKAGRIVLDTTHPEVKQVLIKVSFAVED